MGLNREGSILLDGVFCEGTEKSIMDCMPNPIGSHDCSHGDDVILFCEGMQYATVMYFKVAILITICSSRT